MTRQFFLLYIILVVCSFPSNGKEERPNILFFFVDDWGRYASIYADRNQPSLNDVIQTPNFDRIGREGVVFQNAFVPVASCGPCRASLATGRYFWNCGSGAFLNGKASDWKGHKNPIATLPKFGDLLRENGYLARKSVKTFAFDQSPLSGSVRKVKVPKYQRYGLYVTEATSEKDRKARVKETLDHPRMEMRRVLADDSGKPFFFVYGTVNVHRPYTPDSGKKLWGIEPDKLKGLIPPFLPDVHDVRRDFSDYLGEVLAADAMLGVMLDELETAGKLDRTLVIISGDHGIPGVPRGKTNCYDLGTHVSLMARLPGKIKPKRSVQDFVSITDIGPTLLELAGVAVPKSMDGDSFHAQLIRDKNGWIDPKRDRVILGRELHVYSARAGSLPYPMRAVRTKTHLYIKNFKPERWPMGDPYDSADLDDTKELYKMGLSTKPAFQDLDGSITKAYLLGNSHKNEVAESIALTMDHRPAEELYDLRKDPHQLNNLAKNPEYAEKLKSLNGQLMQILEKTKDPRLTDRFDKAPWIKETK